MSGTRAFNQTLKQLRQDLAVENRRWSSRLVEMPRSEWPAFMDLHGGAPLRAWRSCDFLVMLFEEPHKSAPRLTVIRARLDDRGRYADGITWDELQAIKSEVGYGDREAIEIYPPDGAVVNIQNMRHLWILSAPSGFAWRQVPTPSALKRAPEAVPDGAEVSV